MKSLIEKCKESNNFAWSITAAGIAIMIIIAII